MVCVCVCLCVHACVLECVRACVWVWVGGHVQTNIYICLLFACTHIFKFWYSIVPPNKLPS